jgi:hypothetical protein
MGAWGIGAFENDDALDWVWGLDGEDADETVMDAVNSVAHTSPSAYLDLADGAPAIAACHLVASCLDGQTAGLPPEARAYVERRDAKPDDALVRSAIAALDRVIAADSEVAELWDETDDGPEWRASVTKLRDRLAAHA